MIKFGKKLSRSDRIFHGINWIFIIVILLVVSYPLLFVAGASFNDGVSAVTGLSVIPAHFSLKGYEAVFGYSQVWRGYRNSLLYMVTGTLINLAITIAGAYPLSRRDLKGRNAVMALFAFTMYFSGGLIPTYLLVRDLNMIDTLWAMVIPGAMSVYNVIIMRTYFSTQIPVELLEASQLDGCGNIRFLITIALPLSVPILAVIGLFYAVGHWNAYFSAIIYLKSSARYPLQIVLRDILILNDIQAGTLESLTAEDLQALAAMRELMKYALIIVASLPVLCLYPFVQKYFVKGIMIGAIKG